MEDHRPKLVYGDKEAEDHITEVLDNCLWRRATMVDGKAYWATNTTGGIGEQIRDGNFKVRHIGDYILLAPIEEHGPEDPEARAKEIRQANDARVNAFLKSVAQRLLEFHQGRTEPEEQREGAFRLFTKESAGVIVDKIVQQFVEFQSQHGRQIPPQAVRDILDEKLIEASLLVKLTDFLPYLVVDEVLVTDVHGHLDEDFDNPGPELKEDSQMISNGHLSFKNRDFEGLRRRVMRTNMESLLRPLNRMNVGDDDAGYESNSSRVSQDHCRISPYYPACEENCWLRNIEHHNKPAAGTGVQKIELKSPSQVYESLEPDHIRILTIEPGPCDTPISCKLTPHFILALAGDESEKPKIRFEALSYTWGDPTPCHFINCNGHDLPIADNLYHALQFLRLEDRPVLFWIDAICINQNENAEKSEQIRHMYKIYEIATQVVVWLGPHYDNSEMAMQSIKYLKDADNRETIMRRDHGPECVQSLKHVVASLENLFHRQWFERSWIRQEVAAARKVVVRCGDDEIEWSSLKRIANCIWRLQEKIVSSASEHKDDNDPHPTVTDEFRSSPLRYLKRKLFPGQSLLSDNGDLRSVWYYHAGGFLDHLMVSRAFQATNPRDKVYAVLGIADVSIESENDPEPQENDMPKMRVDYGASVSEVYQYTAKYIINRDRNLDVLCILSTHRDANSTDLPTWTPDWRVPSTSIPLYANWDYFEHKFGAAGFTKCLPQNQEDFGTLTVQGFPLNVITELLPFAITSIPHPPEEPTGTAENFDPQKHLRRLALTNKGNAIVPTGTEVGDLVWVLWGCKMPIVLRIVGEAEDTGQLVYAMIGPCYIPAYMWGKAVKEFQESGDDVQEIVLV